MRPAVETRALHAGYSGAAPTLTNVSLHLAPGCIVALRGSNGAGKTTLLRTLAGLLAPLGGAAFLAGEPAGSLGARAAVTFLPDTPSLLGGLALGELLELVTRLHGIAVESAVPTVAGLGAAALLDQLPERVSRGQRQLAGLVLGLARPWSVALLDEPTTALDAEHRVRLVSYLRERAAAGATVLCATHDPELQAVVDAVVVVEAGSATGWDPGVLPEPDRRW